MTVPLRSHRSLPPDCPHLLAGLEALARGAWEAARGEFRASLASMETPQAWEGLAAAAIGVTDAEGAIEAHERAYAIHRERGDRREAARLALALMWDTRNLRGDPAFADGWLERARELLEGLGDVPERGWLLVREADSRLMPAGEFHVVVAAMAEARAIAREHGDTSLEMEVAALEGAALLRAGQIAEGLRRLDLAAAAASAGEVDDYLSAGSILCQVLSAYEKVRDYDRAAKWHDNLQSFAARKHARPLGSLCRNYFAGLLIVRGRWTEAEAALAVGPRPVPWVGTRSVARLGELRLRQGRLDEAEAHLRRVQHLPDAQLALAELSLERGDARAAADLLERYLRQMATAAQVDLARALSLAVRVRAALGEHAAAEQQLAVLESLAAEVGTHGMHATARFAAGHASAARGDHEGARLAFEDAVDGWVRAGMPFERSAARLELSRALLATGREGRAREEAARAREEFEELGAARAAAEASALEGRLDAGASAAGGGERLPLSAREQEVLALVAQGLSNKEVAARLFLSEHTVKRHLANILTRLGLPSRAAAAAYAVRNGLS